MDDSFIATTPAICTQDDGRHQHRDEIEEKNELLFYPTSFIIWKNKVSQLARVFWWL